MKTRIIFLFLFLILVISSVYASETIPVCISPGSDDGIAVVAQSCPTFSWTAVDWAEGYRVTIFEVIGEIMPYEETQALSPPVIIKEIRGRALSWTPSSNERLEVGGEYVWYVQAVDAYGQGIWSEGRMFKVDVRLRFDGVEEKVRERLNEQGMSEEVIEDVLEDMKSGVKDVIAYGVDVKSASESTQNRIGKQDATEGDQNTYYGKNTGIITTGLYNSFFGALAGEANTTGASNTFMGYKTGQANIGGYKNTFIGESAGRNNTSGYHNTFVGQYAGRTPTSVSDNTFLGYSAGRLNTTGFRNTFVGADAGYNNTDGFFNTFIGQDAGSTNSTGNGNTFVGHAAGYTNSTGINNTFLGQGVGYTNSTGNGNTFVGYDAGYTNSTGINNTFLGQDAGYTNSTGERNTFIGQGSGNKNDSGYNNVFLGYWAGYYNQTGNENTFIGWAAGLNNISGHRNVFLGKYAGFSETGSDKLYIDNDLTSSPLIWGDFSSNILTVNGQLGVGTQSPGYPMELERTGTNASIIVDRTDGAMNYINATASFANFGSVRSHPLRLVVDSLWRFRLDSDNSLTMKNGATCTAGGEWQNASSRELKENIRNLSTEEAEEALEGLAPVRFNYKADKQDESVGFIAEDVPELVATKDRKGMSAMDVVAVLTKVVQEQQETISELKNRITKLEKR